MEILDLEVHPHLARPQRIVAVYRAPQTDLQASMQLLATVMACTGASPLTTVLGDFNMERDMLGDVLPTLPPHALSHADFGETTNLHTHIDHCLSNQPCGVIETYFSYHKALYALLA